MEKFRLGRTELMVSRSGFGALPIQRVSMQESKVILRKAYENGINFFDTAIGYTDSEEKIGNALSDVRENIIIATKTPSIERVGILEHIDESLEKLKTKYIDIYQFHNPKIMPCVKHEAYQTLLELKKLGKIRHIGITNHSLDLARKAVESGLYETMQFPMSYLSSEEDISLVKLCAEHDMGFIAMKAMAGGLITSAETSHSFLRTLENVLPIWGIQKESELDEFIALEQNSASEPDMDKIKKEREELSGSFCRGCGYCLPCAANIEIPMAARMSLLLRRAVAKSFTSEEQKEKMMRIKKCTNCGACKKRCPYGLDIPNVLKANLADYLEFVK